MLQHGAVVLASQSETRARVLRAAGVVFTTAPARVDEGAVKEAARAEGGSAEDVTLALAALKAGRAEATGALVVGADQLLVCREGPGERWFDKPADMAEARRHLQDLRGRQHELVTAVVCLRGDQVLWRHVSRPVLGMRQFGDAVLDAYLAREGEAVLASVGAYRIEGAGIHLFDTMEGEYSAILGLPMLPLLGFLRADGVLTV